MLKKQRAIKAAKAAKVQEEIDNDRVNDTTRPDENLEEEVGKQLLDPHHYGNVF